jgi:hypothetical protein
MDFGATVESFEGFQRLSRQQVNTGSVWLEDGGARISFAMSRKRWNRGIWKELSSSTGGASTLHHLEGGGTRKIPSAERKTLE